ncbi:MAG: UTP--glucose-1-phosphate uridylyltransferase [Candidatus Lokiarchaeota archaeon]|nr:UTP--glucose-1-phosphate uridylyltransferase [Candidatus Lokiarchaeota archaeon]
MSKRYTRNIKQDKNFSELDIIIPAAGLGKRMKSYGPKSLIKIYKEKSILDLQIERINKTFPKANIILVTGFKSDNVMNDSPDNIIKIENESYQLTNVARSIGIGLRASKNNVLIIYGDLIFNKECLECIKFNKSGIVASKTLMKKNEVGCTINNKLEVENMMYDLEIKWGQISFFKGYELNLLKKICWNPDNYNLFGFEVINRIIEYGGSINVFTDKKAKVIDIDNYKDIELVKGII